RNMINKVRIECAAFKRDIELKLDRLTQEIHYIKDDQLIIQYGTKVQSFHEKVRTALSHWSADVTELLNTATNLLNKYTNLENNRRNTYLYTFTPSIKDEKRKLAASNGTTSVVNAMGKIVTKLNETLSLLKQRLDFSLGFITFNHNRVGFNFQDAYDSLYQEVAYNNKNLLSKLIKEAGLSLANKKFTIQLRPTQVPNVELSPF